MAEEIDARSFLFRKKPLSIEPSESAREFLFREAGIATEAPPGPTERGPLPPMTSPAFPRPGQEVEFVFKGQERATGAPVTEPPRSKGAPLFERFRASFGIDPDEMKRGMEQGLGKAYNRKIRLDTNISGEVVFRNPETGQLTPIDPPGFDPGDLVELAGPLTVLLPEAFGAITGTPAGPKGIIVGGALGAFTGEIVRLLSGKAMGLNENVGEDEILRRAARVAGFSVLGGGAAASVTKLGRFIMTRYMAASPTLPKALFRASEGLEEAQAKVAPIREEVKRLTGEDLPLTSTQVLQSPQMRAAEEFLEQRPTGASIRETRTLQKSVMGKLEEAIKDPYSTNAGIERTGQFIQHRASRGPKRGIATVEAQTETARQGAVDKTALALRGQLSAGDAGAAAREAMVSGQDAIKGVFKKRYSDLEDAAGGIPVDLSNLRATAGKWKKVLDDDIIPILAAEDRPVFEQAAKAGIKKKPLFRLGEEGLEEIGEKEVAEPVSFSSVQRTISSLRDEIRAMKKGVSPRKEIKATREIHDALLKDRNAALKVGGEDLIRVVETIEAEYRESKSLIDRAMIGQIIEKVKGGRFKLRDEQIIPRILANPTGAKEIMRAISKPEYASFAPAKDAIRKGILGEYKNKVVDTETGLANVADHRRFMGQNGPSMREFFTEREMVELQTPAAATQFLRRMEAREKNIIAQLNRSFGMKLDAYEAGEVVSKTFNPNKLESLRRVRTLLKDHPDKWADYQALTLRDVWDEISTFDRAEMAFRVDPAKLAHWTAGKNAALLKEVHGPEFVANLRTLQNALTVTEREIEGGGSDLLTSMTGGRGSALHWLTRVYLAPFSTRGRIMTAGIRLRGKAAERVIAQSIADPEQLKTLVSLRNVRVGTEKAAVIFGQLGVTILGFQDFSGNPLGNPFLPLRLNLPLRSNAQPPTSPRPPVRNRLQELVP